MPLHPILTTALAAWIAATGASTATVSLPEGCTSTTVVEPGKPDHPRTGAMDTRGNWYFAETSGPDNLTTIRMIKTREAPERRGAPVVFADKIEGISGTTGGGMLVHDGVVYLALSSQLLMLRDADGDGLAEQRQVIQDGFGVDKSRADHGFGGLTLGPDGRVYGCIGDSGLQFTTKSGTAHRLPECGAAFRFELNGSGFEIFHTGLRKPGSIAFDDQGNAFVADEQADGTGRVICLTDGGDSGWRAGSATAADQSPPKGSNAGAAFVHPSSGSLDFRPAAGLAPHPVVGFLETGAGRFYLTGMDGRTGEPGVWSFAVKEEGTGMTALAVRKEITGLPATGLGFSPDGDLWLGDQANGSLTFVSAGTHAWNSNEATSASRLLGEGFRQRSPAELLNLLRHPDARVRLASQLALSRNKEAVEKFVEATLSSNLLVRQHGVRGLGIIVRCGPLPQPFDDFAPVPAGDGLAQAFKTLSSLTEDRNQTVRCEALRALAHARDEAGDVNLGNLLADESPRVRYFATLMVATRKSVGFFGDLCDMLDRNANRDRMLGQAGAHALQQMARDSSLLTALATHDSPSVRMAAVIALERLGSPEVTTFLDDSDPAVSKEAARAAHTLGLAPAPLPDQPSSSTNQPATPAEPDIHPAPAGTNPWLYIVIGMLVVTGVLLYVDPRIF